MALKADQPTPIRIPVTLLEKIQRVAESTDKSQQTIMRDAMEIGLEHLKRINCDVAAAINDASDRATVPPSAVLSEHTATYGRSSTAASAKHEALKKQGDKIGLPRKR
jgi:predicted DNA-binding protein